MVPRVNTLMHNQKKADENIVKLSKHRQIRQVKQPMPDNEEPTPINLFKTNAQKNNNYENQLDLSTEINEVAQEE